MTEPVLSKQFECPHCFGVHDSKEEIQRCYDLTMKEQRREKARKFARTGKSQKKATS